MRIALVDPLAYTPPYDHALATALAAEGHAVTLLTSRFPHGRAPQAVAYDREELFAPVSTRLFRRSRLRLAAKGLEYGPSVARLVRRIERLDPDVVHVQWLPRPELDLRWLRRVADERPVVLTAHDVLPRRRRAAPVWPDVLETAERVVVHSQRAVEQLVELGLGRERIARIPHPVFPAEPLPPPKGRTLLFFGLIRDYKGLDVLLEALPEIPDAKLVVAGDPVDPVRKTAGVDWRLGFVPEAEVPGLMAEAAAVVLPYPLLAAFALWILIDGGRPAILAQDRAGKDGVPFRMLKFRTTVQNALELAPQLTDDPFGVVENDPRITKPGRFLRRTGLDELPQLWNVLRGQMSLVGPRPDLIEQAAHYSESDRRRLSVEPGITGWSQVNGRESIGSPARIQQDLWYIDHWSHLLDMKILVRTFTELGRSGEKPVEDAVNIERARAGKP